jgi:hypothetical protein
MGGSLKCRRVGFEWSDVGGVYGENTRGEGVS